jgi:hypothetical protein
VECSRINLYPLHLLPPGDRYASELLAGYLGQAVRYQEDPELDARVVLEEGT